MYCSLQPLDDKNRKLIISEEVAERLGLYFIKQTQIRFGLKVSDISIEIRPNLKNKVILSNSVLRKLNIPLDCSYNLIVKENEISLGPFIGIYMGRKESTVIKKLRLIDSYIKNYQELNGVIFAFSLDNVNKEDLTIGGYYYNPNKERWEKSVLPFPASIFRKNTYNLQWREYFGSLYGNKIFNYKSIDKWEMYDRLRQFNEIEEYLPPTAKYINEEDVLSMLEKYRNVYVKPISGKKGKGIYNIVVIDGYYHVKTREKSGNVEWRFSTTDELTSFLKERVTKGKYIVQKTIELQVGDKVVDFRVGMDKDQNGLWQKIMFISRVSGNSSIVSNMQISGGEVQWIPNVLREIYMMNEQQIKSYTEKLSSLAHTISQKLEMTGLNMGKLAFDFAIDKNQKIWIIEVNSKYPDDSLADQLESNRETYYKIRHTNMQYAKKLAGFDQEMDNQVILTPPGHTNTAEVRKYKAYIAIPLEYKDELQDKITEESKKMDCNIKVGYHEKLKKFELEIQGTDNQVNQFLQNIKKNNYYQSEIVFALDSTQNKR